MTKSIDCDQSGRGETRPSKKVEKTHGSSSGGTGFTPSAGDSQADSNKPGSSGRVSPLRRTLGMLLPVVLVAFGLLGFAFMPWLKLIVAMAVAVTLGSWFGTKLRSAIPQTNFQFWFKLLVTVLALRMIALSIIDLSA